MLSLSKHFRYGSCLHEPPKHGLSKHCRSMPTPLCNFSCFVSSCKKREAKSIHTKALRALRCTKKTSVQLVKISGSPPWFVSSRTTKRSSPPWFVSSRSTKPKTYFILSPPWFVSSRTTNPKTYFILSCKPLPFLVLNALSYIPIIKKINP